MTEFKVGDKVLVVKSTYCPVHTTKKMVGTVCTIREEKDWEGQTALWNNNKSGWGKFNDGDFIPAGDKEITLNGVTYVLNEEQKPDHEWKFGDWARITQPENTYFGQVCFVLGGVDNNGWLPVSFIGAAGRRNTDGVRPNVATYISTAEIPA